MAEKTRCVRVGVCSMAAVLLLISVSRAGACPIPVFQYSLEYWDSSPYELVVHYDGEFTAGEQAAADVLRAAEKGQSRHANLKVSWRDYATATIGPPEDKKLPYMELSYPQRSGIRGTLWEGPLEKSVVEEILHSPARQKIAERLLGRHAAVWVLLESGNRSEDRKVRRFVEKELARLEKTLEVPDPAEQYGMDMGDIHTDIDFSLIALRRDEPDEEFLISMLFGTERDLKGYADEPVVFPIYGRGLILYALVGDGINTWTLNDAGKFLTGPCSCQAKSGNPGTDMLMSIDWGSEVERRSTYSAPGIPETRGFLDRVQESKEVSEE